MKTHAYILTKEACPITVNMFFDGKLFVLYKNVIKLSGVSGEVCQTMTDLNFKKVLFCWVV